MNDTMSDKALQQTEQSNIFSNSDNPITAIARIAASGAGKEVVEQMMALVDWDEKRRATAEFNAAFSNAKQKFKKAKKSGYNTHLKSAYSLLEDYDEATREALAEFGLSWRHVPASLPDDITSITCILAHKSGHSEKAEMQAPSYSMTNNAVNKLQSVGIVNMYLKRLTLSAMLGLVSDSDLDNDGSGSETAELITTDQAIVINDLLTETMKPVDKFLAQFKFESIESIPAKDYDRVILALNERKRKIEEKKAGA